MTKRSLVDPDAYIGTITVVAASWIQANMPLAATTPDKRGTGKGAVGEFVFVDCDLVKLLGRIVEIKLPDAERLTVEPALGRTPSTNPVGKIQLLASVDVRSSKLLRGLGTHPRVGDGVYRADPTLLGELIANALNADDRLTLNMGRLDAASGVELRLPPEKILGRHCGIFGATGGGKSWTVATLIAQIKEAGGKAILFDPTGEFANVSAISKHYAFDADEPGATQVHFPYRRMTEDDLFALFRPSPQSQAPKLREAIRSQKLISAIAGNPSPLTVFENRIVMKRGKLRAHFFGEIGVYRTALHDPHCDFDIQNLSEQLQAECVQSTDFNNPVNFGPIDQNAVGHCEGLIARIRILVNSNELACLFGTSGPSLATVMDEFINSETDDIIRVSFKNVRFEHNTREILMNVIGRFLLGRARSDQFRSKPTVVILDEAHQFLGKTIGDDLGGHRLDAFGVIAKEGRKYGLTCVMATQRPRDVPADVLSQLGTLIVHRLTNDEDRQAVERACGDLDRNAALFIPTLAPGEAIIIGPDLPAPVPILIHHPPVPPNSKGPDYDAYWRSRRKA